MPTVNVWRSPNFIKTTRNQVEDLPVDHPIKNYAFLSKVDWDLNNSNKLAVSYNYDYSKNTNQTFDVATYGNSANGIEGPSKINVVNVNLFTTLSPTKVNEAHFSYSRELRPRSTVDSNVPADTGIGFAPSFRFGFPFFLEPNVDELLWRTHAKDNFSWISGNHTVKFGGEWIHTLNDQTFRGFFTGRYLFDSATGFLRYASPQAAGGFGPSVLECFNGAGAFTGWRTPALGEACPAGSSAGGPLLLYLQNGISTGISGVPPPGKNIAKNDDYGLFVQDSWRRYSVLNSQLWFTLGSANSSWSSDSSDPNCVCLSIGNPNFPSDGTLHSPKKEFQPRVGFAWDISKKGTSVLRASYGIFYGRQNMLSQVGSLTDQRRTAVWCHLCHLIRVHLFRSINTASNMAQHSAGSAWRRYSIRRVCTCLQ